MQTEKWRHVELEVGTGKSQTRAGGQSLAFAIRLPGGLPVKTNWDVGRQQR